MIRNFKHKGLQRFYVTGNTQGIIPAHANRISIRLEYMDSIISMEDLLPAWKCHPLYKNLAGHHAIKLSSQWRIVFRFEDDEFCDVDYLQYHG